jgi:hypothetical protein
MYKKHDNAVCVNWKKAILVHAGFNTRYFFLKKKRLKALRMILNNDSLLSDIQLARQPGYLWYVGLQQKLSLLRTPVVIIHPPNIFLTVAFLIWICSRFGYNKTEVTFSSLLVKFNFVSKLFFLFGLREKVVKKQR